MICYIWLYDCGNNEQSRSIDLDCSWTGIECLIFCMLNISQRCLVERLQITPPFFVQCVTVGDDPGPVGGGGFSWWWSGLPGVKECHKRPTQRACSVSMATGLLLLLVMLSSPEDATERTSHSVMYQRAIFTSGIMSGCS